MTIPQMLDRLINLNTAEALEPSDVFSDRRKEILHLESMTFGAELCEGEWHGEQCQRAVNHDGNCCAVLIFG